MADHGLVHWTDQWQDEDDWWWASCRCGWTDGSFVRHQKAAARSRVHREEPQNQAENDAYVKANPQ